MKGEGTPSEETKPVEDAKPPEEVKPKKARTVTIRALRPYRNGTVSAGLPEWNRGEVREVTVGEYKQLQEDGKDNFELVEG